MTTRMLQYTSPVLTLESEDTINDALFLMQKNDVKRVIIVQNDRPIGIVTERDIGRFLGHDKTKRTLDKIPITEIMSQSLVTITLDNEDMLMQSAIRMDTFQISSVIVVDNDGKLVGIVTKSDLARNFVNIYGKIYKVKDYMSRRVITCRKSDSLVFALNMLNKNKISRLVVTNNEGKPGGIITYDTFMRNSGFFKGNKCTRDYLLPAATAQELTVGDLIGSDLLTVESEDDLATAAKLMTRYKVSGIPVVDGNGSLEGVISSSDIVRAYSEVETHVRLTKKDPHFD